MPARLIRFKSALLLAVFLSAGTSLPSLDGLLFHRDAAEPQPSQTHIEPAGGCLDHSEHCVLGRTASGAGAVATLTTEIRIEPDGGLAGQLASKSLLSTAPRGIPNCRAPPVLLV